MQMQLLSPNLQFWGLSAVDNTCATTGTAFVRPKPSLRSREKTPIINLCKNL